MTDDAAGNAAISSDRPTVVFFGTSHCWNTNREAERVVALYPQYRDRVHFVIVDLNHVAPAQHALVTKYYGGYIPTLAIFDRHGKVLYDRAGETAGRRSETLNLAALIDSALFDGAVETPPTKMRARNELPSWARSGRSRPPGFIGGYFLARVPAIVIWPAPMIGTPLRLVMTSEKATVPLPRAVVKGPVPPSTE
jgi:hypothetical protein